MSEILNEIFIWIGSNLNLLATFSAIGSTIFAYYVLRETIKLRKVETEPEISVYLQGYQNILELVIKNIGRGAAYNLNWEYDRDAPLLVKIREGNVDFDNIEFFRGWDYMAPNQEIRLLFGRALSL